MYIFDLDGTLIDSNGIWGEVDDEFLARRGLKPTPEYTETVGRAIFPTAAQYTRDYYGIEDSPEDIMAEWEALAEHHYRHTIPLKPGAKELLAKCQSEGIPLALFTASVPALCRAATDRLGLTEYFDHMVFAQEIGLEKHNPLCFTKLSEILGEDPANCTLFDDSPANCATARAAGMTAVGVYDRFYAHRQEELKSVCSRYVASLEELL